MNELITEDWLREVGFKWHQLERQDQKHWVLWLGDAIGTSASFADLGVELSFWSPDKCWFCWLRADYAGRYSRFLHVRHIKTQAELVRLIEGLTGLDWHPENVCYGSLRTPQAAERIRQDEQRLDLVMVRESPKRFVTEEDESRGRALPEHLNDSVKNGTSQ